MGIVDLGPYTSTANIIFLLILSVAIFTFILLVVASFTVIASRSLLRRIERRLSNLETLLGGGKAPAETGRGERGEGDMSAP